MAEQYWALQCRPRSFHLANALNARARESWRTYRSHLRKGDKVLIWQTIDREGRRGVVGFGHVLSNPSIHSNDRSPYNRTRSRKDPAERVWIKLAPAKRSLWLDDERYQALLSELTVSRSRNPICRVSLEHFKKIVKAAGGWDQDADGKNDLHAVEELSAVMVGKKRAGQAFQRDIQKKLAVEQYAMKKAKAYYSRMWNVADVSKQGCYDLHCTNGSRRELRVEVKGTTSAGEKVFLTRGEVENARNYDVELFIVCDIVLSNGPNGPVASGGKTIIKERWKIDDRDLSPLTFEYSVRTNRGSGIDPSRKRVNANKRVPRKR